MIRNLRRKRKRKMTIDGLVMMQPFAAMISRGDKDVEQRDSKPPDDKINVPIYILARGKVYAKVIITSYFKNGDHWDWNLKLVESYLRPLNYKHPQGAQKWVKNVIVD